MQVRTSFRLRRQAVFPRHIHTPRTAKMTYCFTISCCPYASLDGDYNPDIVANQYIHLDSGSAHYLYFDEDEQKWIISDYKTILCQAAKADEPPRGPWECWNMETSSYAISDTMEVKRKPLTPDEALCAERIRDCHSLKCEAAGVQARREWIQCRDALEVQYEAAEKVFNFTECAKLWQNIIAQDKQSKAIVPSVEHYKTLSDRHAKMLVVMEGKCEQYMSVKDFPCLEACSRALVEIRALDKAHLVYPTNAKNVFYLHTCDVGPVTTGNVVSAHTAKLTEITNDHRDMLHQYDGILTQTTGMKAREEWVKRRASLQTLYDAAEAAKKFLECAKLGKDCVDMDTEGIELPLSAENYRTLGERYLQLVSRYKQLAERRDQAILDLDKGRRELLAVKDFAGLSALDKLQTNLQALTFDSLPPPPHVFAEHQEAHHTHRQFHGDTQAIVLTLHHPDHTAHVVDALHTDRAHSADHSVPVVSPEHHTRTHTTESNMQSDDCYSGNMCNIM